MPQMKQFKNTSEGLVIPSEEKNISRVMFDKSTFEHVKNTLFLLRASVTIKKFLDKCLILKCTWNCRRLKIVDMELLTLHWKKDGSSTKTSETSENVFLFVFISSFVSFSLISSADVIISSGNISCECALNFDQRKTFSGKYKPVRVWLWSHYKITENNCRSLLLT